MNYERTRNAATGLKTMMLKIVQAGDPVLRAIGRRLTIEEIKSSSIQSLIESMRDTMRAAPGVGLAAPQIGESIQLAVIEDRADYLENVAADQLKERHRLAIDFHVIINPNLSFVDDTSAEFFEGCLSVEGFQAIVQRSFKVHVECLNERAEPITIDAEGWYARILQHEIDHLNGRLYIDRMESRTFSTNENLMKYWK
ncbi:MAG TPA: peptide deformylase [Pyrinomonadaceae bacterium]|nr:peptide deformylase [Pyrinomonadaceae bacterium]